MKIVIFYCLATTVFYIQCAKQFPGYIQRCRRNDPNLSLCWKNTFQAIREYLLKGIPEFNIPSIDPLRVAQIKFNQGNATNAHFESTLSDLDFAGASHYEVLDADVDLQKMTFKNKLLIPQFIMTGDYTSKGRLLLFQFDSHGKVHGNFSNVVLDGIWYTQKYKKKSGNEHLKVVKEELKIEIEKTVIFFDDLFKGNPELTNTVNQVVNDNSDVFYEDIQPVIAQSMGRIITEYTSRVYNAFSIDELFPLV